MQLSNEIVQFSFYKTIALKLICYRSYEYLFNDTGVKKMKWTLSLMTWHFQPWVTECHEWQKWPCVRGKDHWIVLKWTSEVEQWYFLCVPYFIPVKKTDAKLRKTYFHVEVYIIWPCSCNKICSRYPCAFNKLILFANISISITLKIGTDATRVQLGENIL